MNPGERVLIVSIPEAGTPLLAEVLIRLGHSPTHLLVRPESYERQDPAEPRDGERRSGHRVAGPWQATLRLIGPGQFAVGHLPFDRARLDALRPFRVLFLKRNPRACLVAHMRRILDTPRRERYPDATWLEGDPRSQVVEFLKDRGWTLSNTYRSFLPWNDAGGVQTLRFEDLLEQRAHGLLEHDAGAVRRAIADARNTATRTATDLLECWSDRAEAVYRLLFKDVDRRLGYDAPAPHGLGRETTEPEGPKRRLPAAG